MNAALNRRELIAGVAAAIAAAGTAGFPHALYAAAKVTVAQFIALSEWLTGTSELDAGVAKTLLGGFLATGNGPALAQLANKQSANGPVANAVVAAWYTGMYETGKGRAVATADRALMWNVLTFTKPIATCGGATGYWAFPPET
jgi:Membrane bound FAD containing D-sorbitol dehydrogenase